MSVKNNRTINKDTIYQLHRLVADIELQATRKNRANSNKVYLITDLEIIERKSNEVLDILKVFLDEE